jgi:hypothetical protein
LGADTESLRVLVIPLDRSSRDFLFQLPNLLRY